MAEDLGESVVLEQPVIRVVQTESGVTVTTSNGDIYKVCSLYSYGTEHYGLVSYLKQFVFLIH